MQGFYFLYKNCYFFVFKIQTTFFASELVFRILQQEKNETLSMSHGKLKMLIESEIK